MNTTIHNVFGASVVAALIITAFVATLTARAAPDDKVTICHATESETNPFVTIHTSENAINGHFENNGTTKAGHEGDLLLQGEVNCPGDNGNENPGTGTSTPINGTLTGTVTAPTSTATTTATSTLTGTVTAPTSTLTGTVTAPGGGSSGGGGGGGSGGGGGGGSSPVVTDYCPNIDGVQTSLPAGQGIANGICVALGNGAPGIPNTGGVGGGNGEVLGEQTPGVPNTGAGGNAPINLLILVGSGIAAVASGMILRRSYFI